MEFEEKDLVRIIAIHHLILNGEYSQKELL